MSELEKLIEGLKAVDNVHINTLIVQEGMTGPEWYEKVDKAAIRHSVKGMASTFNQFTGGDRATELLWPLIDRELKKASGIEDKDELDYFKRYKSRSAKLRGRQIDSAEIRNMLNWLGEQGPLLDSSDALRDAAVDMRKALIDIWAAVEDL